jgi:MFS family permease
MTNQATASSYRWIILIISSLLIMFLFMIQIAWSIELGAPEVEEGDIQWTFGEVEYEIAMLGFSLVVLTQGIGNFFQGSLVHRIGFRKTFVIFLPFLLIPQFLIPYLPKLISNSALAWSTCLALRAVQGFGLVFAVLSPLVGCWFPSRERGLAQGIFMTAVCLNTGIGALIVGLLTNLGYGWEKIFIFLGILILVFSVGWICLIKEPPLEEQPKRTAKIRERTGKIRQSIYLLPSTWMVVWIISMNCWIIFGAVGNASPYLSAIGYGEPFQKSLALLFLSLAGVIATPLGGKISDLLIGKVGLINARSRSLLIGFSLATGFAILYPWLAPLGFSLALISTFLVGFGGPWTSGSGWALPADLDPEQAGKISGIALIIGQAVGALSSYLVAYFSKQSWHLAYSILGIVALFGLLPCLLIRKFAK